MAEEDPLWTNFRWVDFSDPGGPIESVKEYFSIEIPPGGRE
jgi:hypothetical protein